ncbi:MAG: N-acetyl-gamma-glutamyl-phosphate reductase [Nitrospirae bacterium]|nr:MAG: N-acetyl-gamma-glutamyl-phosphate reductase [Nitrospirota bacterium]
MTRPATVVHVAVAGASGYAGAELLRLLMGHPRVKLTAVTSEKSAGSPVASVFPHLASVLPLSFEALAPEAIAKRADLVFLALPHTTSLMPASVCLAAGKHVVDLSADYRLKDPGQYETWYQTPHPYPDILKEAVYGLPELHKDAIRTARLVASPGCYPTAAILQLAPLVAKGLIQPDSIVIDAKSGVSGAGRSPALAYHFPEAHESIEAYKVGRHRHIPEIEQELNALAGSLAGKGQQAGTARDAAKILVAFTPHLVPMNRGILSTAYCRLKAPLGREDLRALYKDFYKDARFVRLQDGDASANPRHVRGSNFCDLALFTDARAGWVVTVCALDNLVKGAAGQAIQAMNLMLGFPEETGLLAPGVYP